MRTRIHGIHTGVGAAHSDRPTEAAGAGPRARPYSYIQIGLGRKIIMEPD